MVLLVFCFSTAVCKDPVTQSLSPRCNLLATNFLLLVWSSASRRPVSDQWPTSRRTFGDRFAFSWQSVGGWSAIGRRQIGDSSVTDWRLMGNYFCVIDHHDNTTDTVASLITKQNMALMVMRFCWDILSSELFTFSIWYFWLNSSIGQLIFINIFRSLNFGSKFYNLFWCYGLVLTNSIPQVANTFNACGETMFWWQDSILLKLALQPICDQSPIGCRLVVDWSPISRRLVTY